MNYKFLWMLLTDYKLKIDSWSWNMLQWTLQMLDVFLTTGRQLHTLQTYKHEINQKIEWTLFTADVSTCHNRKHAVVTILWANTDNETEAAK